MRGFLYMMYQSHYIMYIYILGVFTEKPYSNPLERKCSLHSNKYIEPRDVTWL